MDLQLEIIKVSKPETKKGKFGNFRQLEVTYKDLTTGGKVGGKKLVDFGDSKNVFEAALDWKEDQVVNIQNEKLGDFWTWVAVNDGTKQEEVPTATFPVPSQAKKQWVPDEVRQRLIVRQSALERAIQWESYNNNSPSTEDLFSTAERFVDWVFEVAPKETTKRGRKPKVEVEPEVE